MYASQHSTVFFLIVSKFCPAGNLLLVLFSYYTFPFKVIWWNHKSKGHVHVLLFYYESTST